MDTPTKVRLERCVDERATVTRLHEDLIGQIEARDEHQPTDVEDKTLKGYREKAVELDQEIEELHKTLEREEESVAMSRKVRAHLAGRQGGVEVENGETKYRSFAVYARDQLITKWPQIATLAGGNEAVQAARERLMRAPEHTLSADVAGLLPAQHIAQIMDVIDKSRPTVVSAGRRVSLEKGVVTYPRIPSGGRPTVELQATEKTEGGTLDMNVDLVTVNAVTYIGGGNLSWQVINWSTPDALQLWFDLAAESYALRTETKAAQVLGSAGDAGGTSSPQITGTSNFSQVIGAIASGAGKVYSQSGAMADTLWVSPDLYFYLAGLTSDQGAKLVSEGGLTLNGLNGSIGGLRVIASRGFTTGEAYIGDSSAFIVAESPNAPVELRAVEPAIGGYEVGLIGAFAAAAFSNARFAKVGTG
jgi:HK97 family phage major capsid protein